MTVTFEASDGVGIITLRREHKRNAIDGTMTELLDVALAELEANPSLRAGVLTGGRKAFSAGTDLAEFDRARTRTANGGEYGIARRERTTPIVAAVEGPAVGGGVEILLACDLVVAGDTSTFAMPEVARGVVASCGGLFRLPRVVPPMVARELLLVGEAIGARRAEAVGLVNRVVPAGQALDVAIDLATRIAGHAPVAIRETLRAVQGSVGLPEADAWAVSDRAVDVASASADAQEGRRAFLERREPQWSGR